MPADDNERTRPGGSPAAPGGQPRALMLAESLVTVDRQTSLLSRLTPDEYAEVQSHGQRLFAAAGRSVFHQGEHHDGIFLIEAGLVRSYYVAPSGREITLAYWPPGNFVGGPEVFGEGEHIWSGEAVEDSHLLLLRGKELRPLMERIPHLAIWLVDALILKGACYSRLLQMLGTRSVIERLAQLLLVMSDLHGKPGPEGIVIDHPVTHEFLANMVGSTRQWVTNTLERFRKQGIVAWQGKRLVILDGEALRSVSG